MQLYIRMILSVSLCVSLASLAGCKGGKRAKDKKGSIEFSDEVSGDAPSDLSERLSEGEDDSDSNAKTPQGTSISCTHGEGLATLEELESGRKQLVKKTGVNIISEHQNSVGEATLTHEAEGPAKITIKLYNTEGKLAASGTKRFDGTEKWPDTWLSVLKKVNGEDVSFGCSVNWP